MKKLRMKKIAHEKIVHGVQSDVNLKSQKNGDKGLTDYNPLIIEMIHCYQSLRQKCRQTLN
jgi:hypothetical protein